MAAGTAPALDPKNSKPTNSKDENELTQSAKPKSFKEWFVRKLEQIFEHNHKHDAYPGL